jgi:hypothetical protein
MPNMLNSSISRRSVLKLGVISSAFLVLPLWGNRALAQSTPGAASKAPEGLISFNAGWAIPLEDKPALLALEQAKTKEAQAAISQSAAQNSANPDATAKPVKKSWTDKAQEAWSKVKGFF